MQVRASACMCLQERNWKEAKICNQRNGGKNANKQYKINRKAQYCIQLRKNRNNKGTKRMYQGIFFKSLKKKNGNKEGGKPKKCKQSINAKKNKNKNK